MAGGERSPYSPLSERASDVAADPDIEAQRRFQIMADNAPVMLWMAGTDAHCVFFNKTWLDFTGRTMDEEVGYGWAEGVHPQDFQQCFDRFVEAFCARQPFSLEYRLQSRDGTYRWVLDRGAPRFEVDGTFAGYVGSAVDITPIKEAEAERQRLHAKEHALRLEAERHVAEAREANRLKDEFLATVSHELRTPLSAIIGWADLMAQGAVGVETLPDVIDTIQRNAHTQAKLIDDLLDMSRIITGKMKLEREPVDLATVISGALDSLRLSIEAKGIELALKLDRDVGPVAGDAMRLQQIVWNLLANAAKFTPAGGHIGVRLARVGDHLAVQISDDGEGIDPEFLPAVFDRFRQAKGSITRRHGGLGLGLAIVRHLVELHGGTVVAESVGLGRGATFTVKLPQLTLVPSPLVGARRLDRQELVPSRPLAGLKVLVIDDAPDVLHLAQFVLTRVGAEVIQADSVEKAWIALHSHRPKVVVSDIGMPDAGGLDLIARIRKSGGAARDVAAIAMSAHARAEDRAEALAAGFQDYLVKPVDSARLIEAVMRAARNGGISGPMAGPMAVEELSPPPEGVAADA